MNTLSLFDGCSGGQVALQKLGITFDGKGSTYYASEIDKYAMQVTQANFPNTRQLGDVTDLDPYEISCWDIDLMMGGSPCQGFSFAGHQLQFDDPRSKLFFNFVDILKVVKPKYVLLENTYG